MKLDELGTVDFLVVGEYVNFSHKLNCSQCPVSCFILRLFKHIGVMEKEHTHTHTHAHACTHTRMDVRTHTHTQTHICTHTHTPNIEKIFFKEIVKIFIKEGWGGLMRGYGHGDLSRRGYQECVCH